MPIIPDDYKTSIKELREIDKGSPERRRLTEDLLGQLFSNGLSQIPRFGDFLAIGNDALNALGLGPSQFAQELLSGTQELRSLGKVNHAFELSKDYAELVHNPFFISPDASVLSLKAHIPKTTEEAKEDEAKGTELQVFGTTSDGTQHALCQVSDRSKCFVDVSQETDDFLVHNLVVPQSLHGRVASLSFKLVATTAAGISGDDPPVTVWIDDVDIRREPCLLGEEFDRTIANGDFSEIEENAVSCWSLSGTTADAAPIPLPRTG